MENKFISRQEMQTMLDGRPKGVDGKAFIDKWVNKGYTVEGINDNQATPKEAQQAPAVPTETLTEKLSKRIQDVTSASEGLYAGEDITKNIAKGAGSGFGAIADVVGTGAEKVMDAVGVTSAIEKGIASLSPETQKQLADIIAAGGDAVNALFPDNTIRGEVAQALGNVLNVAGSATGATQGAKILKAGAEVAAKTAAKGAAVAGEAAAAVADAGKGAASVVKPAVEKAKSVGRNVKTNIEAAKADEAVIMKLPTTVQQNAARAGVDIQDLNTLSTIEKANLPRVNELLKAAEDFSAGTSRIDPQTIVGKPLSERILSLEAQRKQIGAQLGEVANNLGKLDTELLKTNVLTQLQGIEGLSGLALKGKKLDFKNTNLASALTSTDRDAIQKAFTAASKAANGKQAHLLRQELFEVLDGKKRSLSNITDTQDKALNAIRKALSDTIEPTNAQYKELSNQYRAIVQPLSDIRKLNKNLTPENETVEDVLDTASGLLARRLASNVQSRPELLRVLEALDNAGTGGGKTKSELSDLVQAYGVIGKYYDIAPKNAFKGQIEGAVTGITGGLIDQATKLTATSPAVRQKLLRDLIAELEANASK